MICDLSECFTNQKSWQWQRSYSDHLSSLLRNHFRSGSREIGVILACGRMLGANISPTHAVRTHNDVTWALGPFLELRSRISLTHPHILGECILYVQTGPGCGGIKSMGWSGRCWRKYLRLLQVDLITSPHFDAQHLSAQEYLYSGLH